MVIDGRRVLYFAGTAYLGLQAHPEVIRAACEAGQRYGMGAATSRAGFGNQPPVLEAERAAGDYLGRAEALYLPSAYLGPEVVLAAIGGQHPALFVDEFSHYALFDALKKLGRHAVTFRHRDPVELATKLRQKLGAGQSPLVISDGVFPATGRLAPVPEYVAALSRYPGAGLMLDDAHGLGVLGDGGRGTLEHFGVEGVRVNSLDGRGAASGAGAGVRHYDCATLSKALGSYGGIVGGEARFVERCKAASHVYEGCNAPPAPVTAAAARALRLLMDDPSPRHRLRENTRLLRAGLLRIGLDVEEDPTPVVALDLGDGPWMARVQARLLEEGVAIGYLRYPGTGERGLLRLAVSALHTGEMIEHLIQKLRRSL